MKDELAASDSCRRPEGKEDHRGTADAPVFPVVSSTISANELELKHRLLEAGKKLKSLDLKINSLSEKLKDAKNAELSAQEETRQMEINTESFRVYMTRLEDELKRSKESVKAGRDERQLLLDTITQLNERIDHLNRRNLQLEYEKELSTEPSKVTEDLEMRAMEAETNLKAAKMQAINWRTRYDELFDKVAEMEKKHKKEIESHDELASCFNEKLDDAFKQTLSIQNDLTVCQMRNVVLEKEKEDLIVKIEEYQRSTLTLERNEARRRIEHSESNAESMKLLRIRLEEMEKQMENVRKEKEELVEDKLKSTRDLNEVQNRLGQMERDAESMKRLGLRCDELERNMKELRKEKEDLILSKCELARDLNEARKSLEDMTRKAESSNEYNRRCEELKKKNMQLTETNEKLLKAESTLTRDVDKIREKLEEMKRKSVSQGVRCGELEKEMERLNNEKEQLEDARLILLRNLEYVQCKTSEMTRQSESAKEDLEIVQLQSKVLEKGMKKLRRENTLLLTAKSEMKGRSTDACENEELAKVKSKTTRDLEDTQKRLERMEKLVNDLRMKNSSMKNEIMKIKEEKTQVKEKLVKVHTSLNRANERIGELKEEVTEGKKIATQRDSDLTMYRSRCDELEKEIGLFNDANQELMANKDSASTKYRKRCERLEKYIDVLNERLEKTRSAEFPNEKIRTLETENEVLKTKLDEAQLLMCIATGKIGDLQRGKDELTRNATKSESELAIHRNRFMELEKENGDLKWNLNKAETWIGDFTAAREKKAEMEKFVFLQSNRTSIEEMRVLEMERDGLVLRLKETEQELNLAMGEIADLKKKNLNGTELAEGHHLNEKRRRTEGIEDKDPSNPFTTTSNHVGGCRIAE